MTRQTIANQIFAYLHSIGVNRVFLVPGGGNMFLVDAASTQAGIEVVPTHHEQRAVIAAEYYSGVSGVIGVALVTTGPGSTNAITGIAGAWLDSIPILVLAGQVKTTDLNVDNKLRQKGPQEIDLVSMVSKISKHSKTLVSAAECVSEIANGVSIALSDRPGPVVYEIPLNVQSNIVERSNCFEFRKVESAPTVILDAYADLFSDIERCLKEASRPILLVGNGARVSLVDGKLRDLAQDLGLPVSMTWPTIDLFEFDHELNAGRIGNVAKRFSNIIIQKSDFILVFGCRLDPVLTAHNIENFGHGAKVIVIDIERPELEKLPNRYVKVCADLRNLVPRLCDYVASKGLELDLSEWCHECIELKKKYGSECFFPRSDEEEPISIYEFVESLSKELRGGEVIITGSSGLAIEVFYTHFKNKIDQRIFLTTGLGAMGYGLPALLGASEVTKEKIVLFESDGSLMMNIQELQSLKSRGNDLLIFVLNNDGYASIRATQRNYFDGRFVATDPGSGLTIPKIQKVADCFGFKFYQISHFSEIEVVLREVIDSAGPIICEVVLNPDETLLPKCSVFRGEDNTLVSAPLEDMSPLLPLEELRTLMDGKINDISKTIRDL